MTDTVCDNTREMALVEQGQTYKVKHSRYSGAKLADARAALAMVHTLADDFAEEIAALCAMSVSPVQWDTFLNVVVPRADARSQPLTGRALTHADHKREALNRLYRHDDRVAPWAGTAHGVLQAVNTYEHHESTMRGSSRPERRLNAARIDASPGGVQSRMCLALRGVAE